MTEQKKKEFEKSTRELTKKISEMCRGYTHKQIMASLAFFMAEIIYCQVDQKECLMQINLLVENYINLRAKHRK